MPPNFLLTKWQRNTFLAFDTFLAAGGLIIVAMGMTYHVLYINTHFDMDAHSNDKAAILLVVVGFVTFPVAYFGFIATVKGQAYLIRICSFAIFGLALSTILTGMYFLSFVRGYKLNIQNKAYAQDRWTNRRDHMVFWNTIHFLFECCGYGDGFVGWLPDLPASCCFLQSNDCKPRFAYKADCEEVSWNGSTGYLNGYVSIVIGFLELIGSVLIFILYWVKQKVLPTHSFEQPMPKS